jgi:N utilization substance protein B
MKGSRRRARILALQALYEYDTVGHDAAEVVERLLAEAEAPSDAAEFARELVAGAVAHLGEIDRIIAEAAPSWPISQMSKVDKNILRLAIFEVLFNNTKVPPKAAINEAVELAKAFGSDSSSRFVNGVLGTVVGRTPSEARNPQPLDQSQTMD